MTPLPSFLSLMNLTPVASIIFLTLITFITSITTSLTFFPSAPFIISLNFISSKFCYFLSFLIIYLTHFIPNLDLF